MPYIYMKIKYKSITAYIKNNREFFKSSFSYKTTVAYMCHIKSSHYFIKERNYEGIFP